MVLGSGGGGWAEKDDGKGEPGEVPEGLGPRVGAPRARGVAPGLAGVLVGEDPASVSYVRGKTRDCAEVGIDSET